MHHKFVGRCLMPSFVPRLFPPPVFDRFQYEIRRGLVGTRLSDAHTSTAGSHSSYIKVVASAIILRWCFSKIKCVGFPQGNIAWVRGIYYSGYMSLDVEGQLQSLLPSCPPLTAVQQPSPPSQLKHSTDNICGGMLQPPGWPKNPLAI